MSVDYLEITVDKFIFRVPVGLLYHEHGLWARWDESAGLARVGLSDFAQQANGDIAFVSLPEAGSEVRAGQELATLETIKVDLELAAPFDGQVAAANMALEDEPELINQDPYGAGWLLDLKPATWPVEGLMDAPAYLEVVRKQAEAA